MKRYKYVYRETDRHGKPRQYFRPTKSTPRQPINYLWGSREFEAEYNRLLNLWNSGEDLSRPSKHVEVNTITWLFRQYTASAVWHDLAKSTQIQRRNMMKRTEAKYGHLPYKAFTKQAIVKIRDSFDTKGAARNWVKTMRAVFAWAASSEVRLISDNPALSVVVPKTPNKGAEKWLPEDIEKYFNHHPRGSPARICAALLLYTGQRISDVRILGYRQVENGVIKLRQKKTGNEVRIPMLPQLRAELGERLFNIVWLEKPGGGLYSDKSLSMRMSKWASEAGVNKTSHGFRKTIGTSLAEGGYSEDTIMAVLGHKTSSEARIYIQNAKKDQLAAEAMAFLKIQLRNKK